VTIEQRSEAKSEQSRSKVGARSPPVVQMMDFELLSSAENYINDHQSMSVEGRKQKIDAYYHGK